MYSSSTRYFADLFVMWSVNMTVPLLQISEAHRSIALLISKRHIELYITPPWLYSFFDFCTPFAFSFLSIIISAETSSIARQLWSQTADTHGVWHVKMSARPTRFRRSDEHCTLYFCRASRSLTSTNIFKLPIWQLNYLVKSRTALCSWHSPFTRRSLQTAF